jgi:HSP20 family protein
MTTTEVSKRTGREIRPGTAENLVSRENAFVPDCDIYETDENLYLRLDVPGVERGNVQIEVDDTNTIQIQAKSSFQEPGSIDSREFRIGDYYRSIRLGDQFDKNKISAKVENGVLEVTIGKREEVKPKRIQVEA